MPASNPLPFQLFEFAAVEIDAESRVDPIAMRFEQPIDAVVIAALFVGGQRKDQIAVGDKAFAFQAQKTFHQDGVAFLHVLRASAIEKSVFFDELEGVHGPVFAAGFDHIQVADEEDGFFLAGAVIADDEILFAIVRACDDDFFFLEAGGEQPLAMASEAFVTLPTESLVLVSISVGRSHGLPC